MGLTLKVSSSKIKFKGQDKVFHGDIATQKKETL